MTDASHARRAPWIAGNGETAELIRAHDWSQTPLGPIERWPQSLRTVVGIVLASPTPMALLWGEHGILLYNDAYSVIAGARHPRVLGARVLEGWPEVADFNRRVLAAGLRRDTLSFRDQHLVLYRKGTAEEVWMDLDYSPVRDESGTPAGVLAIVVDTTERRRAETMSRENGERYRAFVANSSEGIWRMEFDQPIDTRLPADEQVELVYRHGRYAEGNDAMARMYGFERGEELIGARLDLMLPRSDESCLAYVRSVIESGYRVIDSESREYDREGRVRHFLNSIIGTVEDGRLRRVWGTQRDVSALKQVEETLREADRRKDEFIAMLSHELRNPLAPLRTGIALLPQVREQRPLFDQTVALLNRQIALLVRLVDDLLDVSRITQDRLTLKRDRFETGELLSRVVEISGPGIRERRQELLVRGPEGPLRIDGDLTRLAQALSNVVNNASKFSPDRTCIELAATREGDELVVRVRDQGQGIAPELLPRVFEMFVQTDEPREERTGLGVGLYLVRKIVELHGGTVAASSEGEARGSEFTLRLPARLEEKISRP